MSIWHWKKFNFAKIKVYEVEAKSEISDKIVEIV
jgi:hypothetical protein